MAYTGKGVFKVGRNEDFFIDSGEFFIEQLFQDAAEFGTPQLRKDCELVQRWLNSGPKLQSPEREKIRRGWKAYLARGIAPSLTLDAAFQHTSERYEDEGFDFLPDLPPEDIIGVFDRLIASDKEIEAKQKAVENQPVTNGSTKPPKGRYLTGVKLTVLRRAYFVGVVAWAAFVFVRTDADYEFLGIYFDQWERDSFFVNLIAPPIVIIIGLNVYRWIRNG